MLCLALAVGLLLPDVALAAPTVAEALEKRALLSVSPTVAGPSSVDEGEAYTLELTSGTTADPWTVGWTPPLRSATFR